MIDHPETLTGFAVRAVDGRIGVVADASADALLVRRRWRLRAHRIIPVRAVTRIDAADRVVWLDRTRRQVARIPQPKGWSGRSGRPRKSSKNRMFLACVGSLKTARTTSISMIMMEIAPVLSRASM